MRITSDFVFFYGGIFSNWARTAFLGSVAFAELEILLADVAVETPARDAVITRKLIAFKYSHNEQWMMAAKAWLFGDEKALDAIQKARDPFAQKKLGKTVAPFDEKKWNLARLPIVAAGAIAKFGADERMIRELLDTGDRTLVEATVRDRIWGIGLDWSDDRVLDRANWRGLNLLGEALMIARRTIVTRRATA